MALPDQLSKGHTFVDGDIVNAASLNEMVDQATALAGVIDEQTVVTATAGDEVLIVRGGVLHKSDVIDFPSGVTSVALSATPASVFGVAGSPITTTGTITLSLDAQAANLFLAGPDSGVSASPAFRAILPADTATVTIIAAAAIDCDLGNVFSKVLTAANTTFALNNGHAGQTIKVWVQQNAAGTGTVHWNPAGTGVMRWPGGTEPVMTTGVGHIDIFELLCMGNDNFYGIRWGEDMLT
jgi:hypothetical protein